MPRHRPLTTRARNCLKLLMSFRMGILAMIPWRMSHKAPPKLKGPLRVLATCAMVVHQVFRGFSPNSLCGIPPSLASSKIIKECFAPCPPYCNVFTAISNNETFSELNFTIHLPDIRTYFLINIYHWSSTSTCIFHYNWVKNIAT